MTTTEKLIKPKRDPESEFYDTLKRKDVLIILQNGSEVRGILAWVSTYSLGVALTETHHVLVMKGSISTVQSEL
jgi:sRNA-binding regulator protein Hfq